jgi:hypothetical protein
MIFSNDLPAHRFTKAPEWRIHLNPIKKNVSLATDIASERLNEISLEDIQIEQGSQDQIYQALFDMVMSQGLEEHTPDHGDHPHGIPCTGFWVEETKELVLFAWSQDKTKTIVIPASEWFLRDDITVH